MFLALVFLKINVKSQFTILLSEESMIGKTVYCRFFLEFLSTTDSRGFLFSQVPLNYYNLYMIEHFPIMSCLLILLVQMSFLFFFFKKKTIDGKSQLSTSFGSKEAIGISPYLMHQLEIWNPESLTLRPKVIHQPLIIVPLKSL